LARHYVHNSQGCLHLRWSKLAVLDEW
jgi:hypothetical protein